MTSVKVAGIDIDVDRLRAHVADGPGRADPGMRRGDDFVARPDIAGLQRKKYHADVPLFSPTQ